MTHSVTRIGTGKVKWEGLEPFQNKVKVRETQRIRYFIKKKGKGKVYLSESLALDPDYMPDHKRHREVVTDRKVQYENTLNTGEKVWWNPIGGTQVILNKDFKQPQFKNLNQ